MTMQRDLLKPATRTQVRDLDNLQRAGVRIRFEAMVRAAGGTVLGGFALADPSFDVEAAATECINAELRGDPLP
jgi:hypothetical protein